jgi:predicted nucleotidyltransferase
VQIKKSCLFLHLFLIYGNYFVMEEKEILSEVENIVGQIIYKYRPLKIILFGSAARREYDKVNDLDFLIIKQDVPLYGLDRMRELDELIDRNIAADMLVYRPDEFEERIKLGDPFIKTVLREGRVLYG